MSKNITIYNNTDDYLDIGFMNADGHKQIGVIVDKKSLIELDCYQGRPDTSSILIESCKKKYNPYKEDAIKYRTMTFIGKVQFLWSKP